jgi:hypothetical protein
MQQSAVAPERKLTRNWINYLSADADTDEENLNVFLADHAWPARFKCMNTTDDLWDFKRHDRRDKKLKIRHLRCLQFRDSFFPCEIRRSSKRWRGSRQLDRGMR